MNRAVWWVLQVGAIAAGIWLGVLVFTAVAG